ncbi:MULTISPECIES: protein TolQ [Sphingobium]|uniref:Biopolymer transport protein TolQ n=1 Tax=Sphingobium lignivorans TaxID=2735886 RepID=A0ABR6NCK9_9SPHN|nr:MULTISPECIES: protein TolQ [Sphingobium]MBB5984248.1 biopolymer transport protein TolQ [Sphingobium lignivorans]BAK64925.1 biopolymer transport protein TolQ [Sphingobium sp. SYK-6]
MTLPPFLAAALPPASTGPITLSPLTLFMEADIVVKIVMLGLLAASVWTWSIIVSFSGRLKTLRKGCEEYERAFWQAKDMDAFVKERGKEDLPSAQLLSAAIGEWRRSTALRGMQAEGTRDRLATAMGSALAGTIDRISDRLNILATVGSVAPFVGLFGTVWGIMRSFTAIAGEQNTSLAVVAPGIAEALFATAIGLFAAIPAVIAYNRLSHGVNRLEARLQRFSDGLYTTFSRELEA